MYKYEFFNCLDSLIADAQTAILATVDEDGRPKMRWMTPTTLKDRQGFIYCVTAKSSKKIDELNKNPRVEWMIQSRALDRIINIKGYVNRLNVFWKINFEDTEFVVLETVLEEAVYFEPMKGRTEKIYFGEEDK